MTTRRSTRDPEIEQRLTETQVARCKELLIRAEHYARLGDMDVVRKRLDQLRDTAKQRPLPPSDLAQIKDTMIKIELLGLKKIVDMLLSQALDCARVDDVTGRDTAITKGREHLRRLVQLGGGEELPTLFERRVEVINTTNSGTMQKEKDAAKAKQQPPIRLTGHPTLPERRRYIRYTAPVLKVRVGVATLETETWSANGLGLRCPPDGVELPTHKDISIEIKVEGVNETFSAVAEVVRVDKGGTLICLRFKSVDSPTLQMTQRLNAIGAVLQEQPRGDLPKKGEKPEGKPEDKTDTKAKALS